MSSYEHGRQLAQRQYGNFTSDSLLRHVILGESEQVSALLNGQHHFNINKTCYLTKAVELGYGDIVQTLLQHDFNPNQENITHYSSLFIACQDNNFEIFQLLLNSPNIRLLPNILCGTRPLDILLSKFVTNVKHKHENTYQLEQMCCSYLNKIHTEATAFPANSLLMHIKRLLEVQVTTLPLLIIKLFPQVRSEFQKEFGKSVAEYAMEVGVSEKHLPFLGASNQFLALRNREYGFFNSKLSDKEKESSLNLTL